jgi:hypothetical protein
MMNNKRLYRAFCEGFLSATAAHLGALGLLVTVDRLVYFCAHVIAIIVMRLLA